MANRFPFAGRNLEVATYASASGVQLAAHTTETATAAAYSANIPVQENLELFNAVPDTGTPIPFEDLPPDVQAAFNARAANYPGLSGEDIYAKVPAHLRDNPDEALQYLESREVSHIESQTNGGTNEADNIMLEDAAGNPNQVRGADNMTPEEQLSIQADNQADAISIELDNGIDGIDALGGGSEASADAVTHVVSSASTTSAEAASQLLAAETSAAESAAAAGAEVAAETALESTLGFVADAVPVVSTAMLAFKVAEQQEKPEDQFLAAAATVGGGIVLAATGLGWLIPLAGISHALFSEKPTKKGA